MVSSILSRSGNKLPDLTKVTDKKDIDMGFSTEKSGTDEKADFSEPAEIDYR